MSDQQLIEEIAALHQREPHPELEGPRLRLHLAVHAVVERQLREGEPAEVGAALQRLMGQGKSRHLAIHAIGEVASEEVIACLSRGERYDEERYRQRLSELS